MNFATLSVLGYTRVQESSADQAAAGFLERSGQSGKGLVEFFDNFRYQEVFSEAKRYPFFRSHPLSSDRIEALRVRVEAMPNYDKRDSSERIAQHALVLAKIQAFLRVLEPYGIKEIAQSGLLAIGRGSKSITERVFKN